MYSCLSPSGRTSSRRLRTCDVCRNWRRTDAALFGVVEYYSEAEAASRMEPADAVAHVDAVVAARSTNRAVPRRKNDRLTLLECDGLASRLRSRPLLHKYELTATIVLDVAAQHASKLDRKDE